MAGKVKTQLVIEGKNNSKKAFNEVNKELNTLNKQLATTGKIIAGALSFNVLAGAIKNVAAAADAYQLMNAKLKLATGTQEEFNTAQKELQRIAAATASPVESLVTLYGRISRPLKEAGRSQADILKVTEAVASSFRVSGASAEEAKNGVIQFAQALGSGALRGDEFNSVAEQAPRLMQALADGIGVPTSALKAMAAEGKLTASVVTEALIGQLPKINAELAGFGDTVGGQITQIQDAITKGIGEADTGPLIDALKELKETLSDPTIQQNLTSIASALVKLAAAGAGGASEFADLGQRIGYWAAAVSGNVSELDKLDVQINDVKRSLEGWTLNDLFYSDEDMQARLEELENARKYILRRQEEDAGEGARIASDAADALNAIAQKELDDKRAYADELRGINDQLIKDGEAAVKKRVAVERKAASELEKAKKEQIDTEKRYKDALAELSAGPEKEASYGKALDLKVSARQALGSGDIENAKAQAQASLKVLQELAAAGKNTYGFAGFIKELRQIELAADGIGEANAAQALADVQAQTEKMKADLDSLKAVTITPTLTPEAAAAATQQMQAFADQISKTLVIPVQIVPANDYSQPYTLQDPVKPQGFATGGHVRGPGTGTSDSIMARLSNGEYVMKAAAVRQYGTSLLDKMNGLALPKFADGGLVSAATSGGGASSLGTVNISLDGKNYSLQADQQNFADLVQRQKWKRGSTRT